MPNVTANTDVTVIRCSYTCNKCYRTSSSAPNGQCDHPLQTGNTAVGDTHLAPHCKTKCWLTSKKPNSKLTCFAHVFVTTLSTQVPDSKNESIWRKWLKKYWGNEAPLLLSYFDPYWHVAKLKLTMHWWWPHKPWYMFSSALLIRTQRMKHMPQLCSYKPKSSTKSNMIHWSPARMSAYLVDRKGEEKNWSSPVISGLPIFLVPGSQQCIPWKRKMCPALLARFCLNESKICNTQLFKLTIKKLSSKINGKKKTAIGTKLSSHLFSPKRGQGWKHPAFFFAKLFSLLVGVPTIFLNISVYVWLRVYVCVQCCFDLLTHAQPSISKIVYFFSGTGTGTATPFAAISGGATSRYRLDTTPTAVSAPTERTRSKIWGTVAIPTLDWNVLTAPVELGPLFRITTSLPVAPTALEPLWANTGGRSNNSWDGMIQNFYIPLSIKRMTHDHYFENCNR